MRDFFDTITSNTQNLESSSRSTLAEWDDAVERSFHKNHVDAIVASSNNAVANLDSEMSDIMLSKQRIYDICNRVK